MFSICLFLICSDMFLDSMSNAFNRFSAIDFYPYLIKNVKEIFVVLMPFTFVSKKNCISSNFNNFSVFY